MRSLDMRSHANHNHVLNHVPTRVTLQGVTEEAFGQELAIQGVEKVKFRIPKDQQLRWATALVTFDSQEAARKACDEGVV